MELEDECPGPSVQFDRLSIKSDSPSESERGVEVWELRVGEREKRPERMERGGKQDCASFW